MREHSSKVSFIEFVSLMGLLTAMTALSTDALLPALGDIGHDLHIVQVNNNQLIISLLFAGMALGQIIYGPLSDTIGRKKSIYIGIGIFIVGCFVSIFSTNLTTMLIGRFLQGLGAASPRIITMAIIRDRYKGREMARVMSFIMTVFIFVPAIAPAFGEGILLLWEWEAIFVSFLLIAILAFVWLGLRQEETLPLSARVPFSLHHIYRGIKETCYNPTAFSYTIIAGIIFGAFLGYLNSAQQIFQDTYNTGEAFALYFGLLALAIGAASFLNAKLVMHYGMRKISGYALLIITTVSILFFIYALMHDGVPSFYSFMAYGFISFFCMGLLFGNLNAMAMEPLGHIAGVGAAVVGSLSTFISIPLGTLVGHFYDGTVLPLVLGFALLGLFATLIFRYARLSTMSPVDIDETP